MCHISHQATHLLFKYYVRKVGGWGVPNLGKLADVILEHSLTYYKFYLTLLTFILFCKKELLDQN